MKNFVVIFVVALTALSACMRRVELEEPTIYTRAAVRLGSLSNSATNAENNESLCGDIHVLNYSSGLRRKYVVCNDYMSNPQPINIEAAVGFTSKIIVLANLNSYWKATHGGVDITENDFPKLESDLETWVLELSRAQIEEHKDNTTDALFLICGRSAEGEIIADGTDTPLDLPIELSRLFSKVDVKLWYDPSVTKDSLDMDGAKVFFSQYVPRVCPFAQNGGDRHIPDFDNPTEPYLYQSAISLTEGTPTAIHSGYYCQYRNFLPPNNATTKLEATYVILEAKWGGKTAYWKGLVATLLAGAPFRLQSNVHLTVEGEILGHGSDNPDITEDISIEVSLHIEEWTVNNLNDIEAGN